MITRLGILCQVNNKKKCFLNLVVLSLDFSGLETRNEELFKESFRKSVLNRMIDFLYSHETLFSSISLNPLFRELKKEKDIKSLVMPDDLTSGCNISINFTTDRKYNEMMGFTQTEVKGILQTLGIENRIAVEDLGRYYDGYLFNIKASENMVPGNLFIYLLSNSVI
jgi:hypothetical protein